MLNKTRTKKINEISWKIAKMNIQPHTVSSSLYPSARSTLKLKSFLIWNKNTRLKIKNSLINLNEKQNVNFYIKILKL